MASFCESAIGAGNVLVVAPHGGLSEEDLLTAEGARRRGNDLHTAGLAREIAEALDASRLVNDARDRNGLDLNRIPDVLAGAAWFLEALEAHLERILVAHDSAVVLVVHAWHVTQARCDLGIGATLESASEACDRPTDLTVAPAFATGPLEELRTALRESGVVATFGERWPAAHRHNLMRLFRRRAGDAAPVPRIRGWVAEGRIDAVQLELGAPLRWPGRMRERFVAEARRAFASPAPGARAEAARGDAARAAAAPADAARAPSLARPARAAPAPAALSLQAFDPQCGHEGLGVVMGALRMPGGAIGARLQLFPGGSRMAIFTGHGRAGADLAVPDLSFEDAPGGFLARFEGFVLDADDAATYFRSEASQAAAALREASVRLAFRERVAGFGDLRGRVELAGERFEVRTTAFSAPRMVAGLGTHRGTRILASLGAAGALRLEADGADESCVVSWLGPRGWEESVPGTRRREASGDWTIRFERDGTLRIRLRTRASMVRPAGRSAHVHVTFGLAVVERGAGERGAGFYEERRPL